MTQPSADTADRRGWSGSVRRWPSVRRWTLVCIGAEAIGMTAAAGAAVGGAALSHTADAGQTAGSYLLVLAGGLVEGLALGCLQASVLASRLGPRRVAAWIAMTLLVAGVGWAAASAPSAVSNGDTVGIGDTGQPSTIVIIAGAAALGLVMGSVLGAAQGLVLRRVTAHPRRWVAANAIAWSPVMIIIFLSATLVPADWPSAGVIALGTATGAAAGAVLGLITGWMLPSLDGPPPHSRVVLALLASPGRHLLSDAMIGLRVTGTHTGRTYELPVNYAADPRRIIVLPGRPEHKTWWRNITHQTEVEILRNGRWQAARADLLTPESSHYADAARTYRRRWPSSQISGRQPLVELRSADEGRKPGPATV